MEAPKAGMEFLSGLLPNCSGLAWQFRQRLAMDEMPEVRVTLPHDRKCLLLADRSA